MSYYRNMVKKTGFILLLVAILAACSNSEEAVSTKPITVVVIDPTLTPSLVPTSTRTAVPISTSMPNPTDTPAPTATATVTPTPLPTSAVWVESGTPVSNSEVIGLENVEQLTELARWGRGVIRDIDLSENGRWLAVASGSGAYIHDLQDMAGKPLAIEVAGGVTAVSISPTGDKIAFVMDDNELQFWQVEPLKHLFRDNDENILELEQIQFSPDGRVLAIVKRRSSTAVVELWDSIESELIVSFRPEYELNPRIKFSPNGSRVAVWSQYDDIVDVYDWEEDILISEHQALIHHKIEGVEDENQPFQALVGDVSFISKDDLRLLVVEGEHYIRTTGRVEIQDTNKDSILFSVDHIGYLSGPIEKACNDPDYFADPPEATIPYQMEVSSETQIIGLRYEDSHWGDYKEYSSLRFHNGSGGEQLYIVEEGVVDFEFSPNGQTWVAGLQDGRLQVRRLNDGAVLESVDAYESPIFDTIVSADDAWVGVTHVDEVKIYQRATGNLQYRYPAATKIAFAPNSKSFTLAYQDGRLELHDIKNGELIKTIAGHNDRVTALDYLPTGELLSAGADCNIMLWEMPNMILIDLLETVLVDPTVPEDVEEEKVAVHIQDFLVMPDGQTVIGQFFDFGIWQMEDGQLIREPSSDYQEYSKILAVSLDGKSLAVPQYRIPESWDNTLTFIGTDADVAGFSPDSNLLVGDPWLYAEDYEFGGMLNVWQVEPKRLLYTIGEETEKVTAVTFTHDGQLMISAALDGIVRLWGIPKSSP